jgi:hypothetical protein
MHHRLRVYSLRPDESVVLGLKGCPNESVVLGAGPASTALHRSLQPYPFTSRSLFSKKKKTHTQHRGGGGEGARPSVEAERTARTSAEANKATRSSTPSKRSAWCALTWRWRRRQGRAGGAAWRDGGDDRCSTARRRRWPAQLARRRPPARGGAMALARNFSSTGAPPLLLRLDLAPSFLFSYIGSPPPLLRVQPCKLDEWVPGVEVRGRRDLRTLLRRLVTREERERLMCGEPRTGQS